MIDKNNFSLIKKKISQHESERETLIRLSRDIVKLSKNIIYSLHRDEIKQAEKILGEAKKKLTTLKSIVKKTPRLLSIGSTKMAVQEYIEALAYFTFINSNKIPPYEELYLDPEYYLLGLCDLTGELVRKSVTCSINNDFKKILQVKNLVDELYDLLIQLDVKGELRPKIDGMRWELKKLDQMVFELKVKDKI